MLTKHKQNMRLPSCVLLLFTVVLLGLPKDSHQGFSMKVETVKDTPLGEALVYQKPEATSISSQAQTGIFALIDVVGSFGPSTVVKQFMSFSEVLLGGWKLGEGASVSYDLSNFLVEMQNAMFDYVDEQIDQTVLSNLDNYLDRYANEMTNYHQVRLEGDNITAMNYLDNARLYAADAFGALRQYDKTFGSERGAKNFLMALPSVAAMYFAALRELYTMYNATYLKDDIETAYDQTVQLRDSWVSAYYKWRKGAISTSYQTENAACGNTVRYNWIVYDSIAKTKATLEWSEKCLCPFLGQPCQGKKIERDFKLTESYRKSDQGWPPVYISKSQWYQSQGMNKWAAGTAQALLNEAMLTMMTNVMPLYGFNRMVPRRESENFEFPYFTTDQYPFELFAERIPLGTYQVAAGKLVGHAPNGSASKTIFTDKSGSALVVFPTNTADSILAIKIYSPFDSSKSSCAYGPCPSSDEGGLTFETPEGWWGWFSFNEYNGEQVIKVEYWQPHHYGFDRK